MKFDEFRPGQTLVYGPATLSEAEIVWTRPTPLGLFESGCRLLRTVDDHTVRKGQ